MKMKIEEKNLVTGERDWRKYAKKLKRKIYRELDYAYAAPTITESIVHTSRAEELGRMLKMVEEGRYNELIEFEESKNKNN